MALPKDDLAVNFGFGEQHSSLIRDIDWKEGHHVYNIPDPEPLLLGPTAGAKDAPSCQGLPTGWM